MGRLPSWWVNAVFEDRIDAGRRLAGRLSHLAGGDTVVVGLPRGGVPVAQQVAGELGAPLDVIVVRKLGVPWQPELAMGAIGEEGVRVLDRDLVSSLGISEQRLRSVEDRERAELQRRVEEYRGGRPMRDLRGKTVIVVDDGIATGSTAAAACRVVKEHGAERIVMATPVSSPRASRMLTAYADEVVTVEEPEDFAAIGQFYSDFSQTSDAEVRDILSQSVQEPPSTSRDAPDA